MCFSAISLNIEDNFTNCKIVSLLKKDKHTG